MKSIDKLVSILRKMGNRAEKVIEKIEMKSPELADLIRKRMFMFEDIASLRREEIALIIRNTQRSILVLSLKGTGEAFREKFYNAVTQRVADTLREDLEISGPAKRTEVESARSQILDLVLKLMDEGKIDRDGKDEIYV